MFAALVNPNIMLIVDTPTQRLYRWHLDRAQDEGLITFAGFLLWIKSEEAGVERYRKIRSAHVQESILSLLICGQISVELDPEFDVLAQVRGDRGEERLW